MARKALVENDTGHVLNVIEVEDDANWSIPDDCYLVGATKAGAPGDTWDGRKFVHPPAPKAAPPTLEERVVVLESNWILKTA